MAIVLGQKAAHKRPLGTFSCFPGRPAPRGAASRLRGGRLSGLDLVTMLRCGGVAGGAAAAAAASAAAAAAVVVAAVAAAVSGGGGCGGGVAGFFPGGVAFDDFFPWQRWGLWCRTFRVGEERDVLLED